MSVPGLSRLHTNGYGLRAAIPSGVRALSTALFSPKNHLSMPIPPKRVSAASMSPKYPSPVQKMALSFSMRPLVWPVTIFLFNDFEVLKRSLQDPRQRVPDFIIERTPTGSDFKTESENLISILRNLRFKVIRIDIYHRASFELLSGANFTLPFEINSETLRTLRFSLSDKDRPNYRFFVSELDLDLETSTGKAFTELLKTAFEGGYSVRFNLLPMHKSSRATTFS